MGILPEWSGIAGQLGGARESGCRLSWSLGGRRRRPGMVKSGQILIVFNVVHYISLYMNGVAESCSRLCGWLLIVSLSFGLLCLWAECKCKRVKDRLNSSALKGIAYVQSAHALHHWHYTLLETRVGRIHVKTKVTKHHNVSQIPLRECLIMFKYKCTPNITTLLTHLQIGEHMSSWLLSHRIYTMSHGCILY